MVDSGPFQVKVLTTLKEVESLRDIWSAMQWFPEGDIDFYSFLVSARPQVIRPHVIVVSHLDKPVSILAGRLEKGCVDVKIGYKTLYRFSVRRVTMPYGGCMGATTAGVSRAAILHLLHSLSKLGADLLLWQGVVLNSELHRVLGSTPSFLCRDYTVRPNQHWTMNLPGSLEEFLEEKLAKKHRYWAKRMIRLLEREYPGQVRYACLSTPEMMDQLFADIIRVARKTYQWGLGVAFQDNEENRQRLRLEAQKGWLRGFLLYLREEPVAFWTATVYGDTAHLGYTGYDPAFRKYEVGTVLFLRMVDALCGNGAKKMDFGLGTAFYKERFADTSFSESSFCIFAPTVRGAFLNALSVTSQGSAEVARKVLARFGLEQKVKRLWRRQATPGPALKGEVAPNLRGQTPL